MKHILHQKINVSLDDIMTDIKCDNSLRDISYDDELLKCTVKLINDIDRKEKLLGSIKNFIYNLLSDKNDRVALSNKPLYGVVFYENVYNKNMNLNKITREKHKLHAAYRIKKTFLSRLSQIYESNKLFNLYYSFIIAELNLSGELTFLFISEKPLDMNTIIHCIASEESYIFKGYIHVPYTIIKNDYETKEIDNTTIELKERLLLSKYNSFIPGTELPDKLDLVDRIQKFLNNSYSTTLKLDDMSLKQLHAVCDFIIKVNEEFPKNIYVNYVSYSNSRYIDEDIKCRNIWFEKGE